MWILGSVLFLVLVGSSVSRTSDLENIPAEPGENVILPCRDPNITENSVFDWTRSDLQEDEYVFMFKEGRPYLVDQYESFKNRVFLNYNQMKDGDLSVVLENLKIEDSGRYMCRVLQKENRPKRSVSESTLITTVNLLVSPPGHGHLGLIAAPVLVVLVLLGLWISKNKEIFNLKFHQASES